MSRKVADCRDFPSEKNCTLTISGEEGEVLKAATAHAVADHGHSNSPELKEQIRSVLKDEAPSHSSASRSMDQPDEVRKFKSHGKLEVLTFDDGSVIGRGTFEPGWKWSNDVKPITGGESCQAPHSGYCLKGSMVIHMDNGKEFTIKKGDAFEIAPGHDAWVTGTESCVLVDVGGYTNYAKKAA